MDEGGSEFEVGDASVFRDITNSDEDGSASTLLSGSKTASGQRCS